MRPWSVFPIMMAAALFQTSCEKRPDQQRHRGELMGTWQIEKTVDNGQAVQQGKGSMCVFKENSFSLTEHSGQRWEEMQIKLYPDWTPCAIDLVVKEGLHAGELTKGIFDVRGDELRLCLQTEDGTAERPTDFSAGPHSGRRLMTLKRVR